MCPKDEIDILIHLFKIPANKWAEIIRLEGAFSLGTKARSYRVEVLEDPSTTKISWRRFALGTKPYASGHFVGTTDFNIYPTDKLLRLQVRSPVEVKIRATRVPTAAPKKRRKKATG